MDNVEANSPIGLAARKVAFALKGMQRHRGDEMNQIEKMQAALHDYGAAIAESVVDQLFKIK
jgi:hypothetical protein